MRPRKKAKMSSKLVAADGELENITKRLYVPNSELYPNRVYSNTNELRKTELINIAEELDDKRPFLEYSKPMIIVDKSTGPMEYFAERLLEELGHGLERCVKYEIETPHYGHHAVKGIRPIVALLPLYQKESVMILARVKGADSSIEKIAKEYTMNESEDPTEGLRDVYGFKIICNNEEDVKSVGKKLRKMKDIEIYQIEKHDKESGYKADHYKLRWQNGNALLNGSKIEVQVKTVEQAIDDIKDHEDYAKRRLAENGHGSLKRFQILVYDNRASYNGQIHLETEEHAVAQIKGNRFADYWLIMKKGGEEPEPMTRLKDPLSLLEQLR